MTVTTEGLILPPSGPRLWVGRVVLWVTSAFMAMDIGMHL